MKNQTFTVDRGQLDDHKYIFFISNCSLYCSGNEFKKMFQDNGNNNKCTEHARGARKKCLSTRVLGDTGCGLK